jgi:hypothetical protein
MRYIIAISALAGVLLLPQIALSVILWQDNFDEYPEGMLLEESPSWDKMEGLDGDSFQVMGESDMYIEFFNAFRNTALYIASGGAVSPEMKVSAHEVVVWGYPEWSGHNIFGGVATRLDTKGNGYVALSEYYKEGGDIYHLVTIGVINNGYYEEVASEYSAGWTDYGMKITIIASGQNPVHI